MIFALLPVKAPAHAKQRLSGLLTPGQRERLARLMFEDVLETLCSARRIDRVVVVTSDQPAANHARRAGAMVFEEHEQRGHSHSADAAARQAMSLGALSVLLAPIDVPLVTAAEIEELVAPARNRGLVIVPSADGTGTNALLRTPPDVIESRFGPGSFQAHIGQAQERGIAVEVARPPGLMFDIDTPEDVAHLLARAPDCRASRFLKCPSEL
jgi:2-phospho-L-lactate guanylyltransferase